MFSSEISVHLFSTKQKQSTNKVKTEQKQSINNETGSQLDRTNEALKKLSANVTTDDRREAMKTWSESTIVDYLNGRGKNLNTAIKVLQFFQKRIKDREKVLS